jgi:hypothetical protein
MAKKKRKRKNKRTNPDETAATEMPIVATEKAAGMSATALATFARDLASFGSRPDSHARGPAR